MDIKKLGKAYRKWERGGFFNCFSFVCYMTEIKKQLYWMSDFEFDLILRSTKKVRKPEPGDIVIFVEDGFVEHAAIYLGSGKYAQKSGMSEVSETTLKGIQEMYAETNVFDSYEFRRLA